jgi:hypothetical protein
MEHEGSLPCSQQPATGPYSDSAFNFFVNVTDYMCGTIRRFMKGKVRSESQLKLYKPTAIYGSKTWFVRQNETENTDSRDKNFLVGNPDTRVEIKNTTQNNRTKMKAF